MATKDEMMKFAIAVEEIVAKTDYNHIEAIVEYCRQTGLEIEMASTLVNSNLKSKIESDAQDLNLLPKTNRLPF